MRLALTTAAHVPMQADTSDNGKFRSLSASLQQMPFATTERSPVLARASTIRQTTLNGERARPNRLIKGAVAALSIAGRFSQVAAREEADDYKVSPCEDLSKLTVSQSVNMYVPGVPFDVDIHGNRFDKQCALISEVDPKAAISDYKMLPESLFFREDCSGAHGYYDPNFRFIGVNSATVTTPGDQALMRVTIRHENRHRNVHSRNTERESQDLLPSELLDPCQTNLNKLQCQQNMLKVPKLFEFLRGGPPHNLAPEVQKKIFDNLRKASKLISDDHVVVLLIKENVAQIEPLIHGKIVDQPFLVGRNTPVKYSLPKNSEKKYRDFSFHLVNSASISINDYDEAVAHFEKNEARLRLVAEYDAVLVGYYGLPAAKAIIKAASYLPDTTQHSEL